MTNEHVLRGMVWGDNFWLFCDIKERLVCMVNDIIVELLDLDMEPRPESLWWTSTHQAEEKMTLSVGYKGLAWPKTCSSPGLPFAPRWAQIERCAKVWAVGGGTGTPVGQRVYPCKRNVGESSVTQCCPERSHQLAVERRHAGQGACTGGQNLASYLSCSDVCRRKLGGLLEEESLFFAHQVEEDGSANNSRKGRGQNLDDYELGCLRWSVSGHEGTSLYFGTENQYMVAEQECVRYEEGTG